jgi:hypothetical protein
MKNKQLKPLLKTEGAIFVTTYSRAEELEECLNHIVAARGSRNIPLIVIHQNGYDDVARVIERWRTEIQVLVQTVNAGDSPLQNINMNGLLGREIAFTWLGADWCIGVEDDVIISKDALNFCTLLYQKHHKDPFFRGVNLGSKRAFDPKFNNMYSKVSFGIHGQASLITKRTWRKFSADKLRKYSAIEGQDSMMEHYIKTGYMCTPCNSRYLDRGWNGTHASKDPNNPHYVDIGNSFFDGQSEVTDLYVEVPYDSFWREDSLRFAITSIPTIYLKNKLSRMRYKLRKTLSSFSKS